MLLNDVYRNEVGQDGIAINAIKYFWDGLEGDGVYFNGSSARIDFSDFGFDHSSSFTLAFWFKTAGALADACLLSNQSGLDTDGYLHIKTTAAGSLTCAVLDGSDVEQTISASIVIDTEYHIVVQYDGTDLSLWIDGVEGTPLTTTIKTTTPTNDLGLGYKVNGVADFCEGYVAGINLYDSSLSDTEIAAIFSEPDGPNTSDIPAIVVPGGSVATQEDIIAMVIALG